MRDVSIEGLNAMLARPSTWQLAAGVPVAPAKDKASSSVL